MECPFSGKLSLFLIFGPIIGSKRVLSRQIIMGHAMWYGKQSKQVRHFNSAQCEGCWKVVPECYCCAYWNGKFTDLEWKCPPSWKMTRENKPSFFLWCPENEWTDLSPLKSNTPHCVWLEIVLFCILQGQVKITGQKTLKAEKKGSQ